jgi:hypothetical protein
VANLEREPVRHCYTDFHLATRINFLSGERVVCSAKLGPITTEYFLDYRTRVEAAAEAALIPVNASRRGARAAPLCARRRPRAPGLDEAGPPARPKVDLEALPGREFPAR